jgi:hypothetical protein
MYNYISIFLSIYLSINLSIFLSLFLSINLSIYLSFYLFIDPPIHLPIYFFWQGAQSLSPATRSDIWTSKRGPNMVCFVHFHFEMCFAPQRRALFRHCNFQKWSEPLVFSTFWLRNVCLAPQRRALFDIATSKSGPKLVCFAHSQRRAIFHLSSGQLAPHPPL